MKHTLAMLCAALSCATFSPQARTDTAAVAVPGFKYVRTVGTISEYTLESNGLTVLLMPERSAPVVTFMVTYRVGSRNEVTGTTGATHLLEHLMFKGSPKYNDAKGNSVKQYVETVGGIMNATTWLDRTNYFAVIGKENLEGYVAIEADRMRNLWLHESDREKEMTVVRNEYERGENDPQEALGKEITAAAFVAHPYHHDTIGWLSDIENVPIEKLRAFYDTYYWPDNATVSIIGDFEPAAALELVKKYYGVYPRSPKPIPQLYTVEPEQQGARRVSVSRAGEIGVVGIAYKTPSGRDADYAALDVLGTILGNGKTSRFYRALTDRNLALGVYANAGFYHDPSLFQVYAFVAPGVEHAEVERVMLEEIERVKADGVTDEELATALAKYEAYTAYGRDGSFAIASTLNETIAAGDWTLYYTVDDATRKVTTADVKRVANQYLDTKRSTTGWFVPLPPGPPAEQSAAAPAEQPAAAADQQRPEQ
ncbi:MAG: insulinase family protein [Steroidobacteraceae bacterium]|nr:insulinase family protein [Steroidobacteraceae bacterium]